MSRACNSFPSSADETVADGAPSEDSSSPYRAGAIIAGKYRLLRQLGRGGMGEVWSAEHLALNTEVAVKFLSTGAGGAAQRLALERFRFEAQVSAHLGQKTAHVVAVHDAGSDASGPYLVMEYVRGHTLRAEITRQGQIPARVVADLLDQVAEALSVAHAFGIIHRDLKPSNLLLSSERVSERGSERAEDPLYVKVADFGIAKAMRENPAVDLPEETSDGWMLGSPAYMSPEQMRGCAVDPRTDMWSLGVIAYEALTGRLPFPGRSVTEIIVNMSVGRFDPPSRLAPSLPGGLDDWFLRALAKNKDRRFRTIAEMVREFRRALLARPGRRLDRVAHALTIAASLCAALLGLRPSPSEALPEIVSTPLPAVLAVTTPRLPMPPQGPPEPPSEPPPGNVTALAIHAPAPAPAPSTPTASSTPSTGGPRASTGANGRPSSQGPVKRRGVLTEAF